MGRGTLFVSVMWILLSAITTFSCSTSMHLDPKTMVVQADLILRATALEYVGPELPMGTRRLWNSNIRFSVEEVVKGQYEKPTFILPGFLTDRDDWNPQNPPYRSARPGADASCFVHGYRKGGQFLLMLKKWDGSLSEVIAGRPLDGYTISWYALGPVNEQLRSSDDPWVQWVREQVKRN